MKRWLDALLGAALVLAWVFVASTASEATARDEVGAGRLASDRVAVGAAPSAPVAR